MPLELLLLLYFVFALTLLLVPMRRALAEDLTRVGRPVAYFVALSLLLLVLVQSYLPHGALYPYASWTMYSQASPAPQAWDVRVRRSDGSREILDPWRVIRGPDARALMRSLENPLRRIRASSDPEFRSTEVEELAGILSAMIRLEGRRGDAAPVDRIEISFCTLPGPPPWSRESFQCEEFLLFQVTPDGMVHAP